MQMLGDQRTKGQVLGTIWYHLVPGTLKLDHSRGRFYPFLC